MTALTHPARAQDTDTDADGLDGPGDPDTPAPEPPGFPDIPELPTTPEECRRHPPVVARRGTQMHPS